MGRVGAVGAQRRGKCDFLAFCGFWRQKPVLGPKSAFWSPRRGRLQNTHFLYGFLIILGAVCSQIALLVPKITFSPQSALLSTKCTFGPKNSFWGRKCTLPLSGPLGRVENDWFYKGLGPSGAVGAQRREKCDFGAFYGFWRQKPVLGPKSAFWCQGRPLPRPAPKHTLSVWFLDDFGSRLCPECTFGAQSYFFAPKCVFGPKVRFWGQNPLLGPK